jgi:hypothetical protein
VDGRGSVVKFSIDNHMNIYDRQLETRTKASDINESLMVTNPQAQ